jgi:hypothetical protein
MTRLYSLLCTAALAGGAVCGSQTCAIAASMLPVMSNIKCGSAQGYPCSAGEPSINCTQDGTLYHCTCDSSGHYSCNNPKAASMDDTVQQMLGVKMQPQ